MGKYVQAELLARDSLSLRRRLFGEQHSDVAKALSCIAGICYMKGDFKVQQPHIYLLCHLSEMELYP